MGSPGSSVMTLTPPAMQGPPGPPMAPLQPPPGMPNPHVPPFLASPNMQHMPPQMMPDGPMFPPNRFRMRMPFPPRGPPFQSCPPVGPEADREGRFFRGVRPGFPCPPFQRGRWWWTLKSFLYLHLYIFVYLSLVQTSTKAEYICVFLNWLLKGKTVVLNDHIWFEDLMFCQ